LTKEKVTDPDFIKTALHWLDYAVVAYGSFFVTWYGKGRFAERLTPGNVDIKAASRVLKIPKENILHWEFGEFEAFKPNFFICLDKNSDTLVLSIRGTWVPYSLSYSFFQSLQDIITDLCAEYEPFMDGYIHRGFLRAAKYLEENYLKTIIDYMSQHKVSNLVLVGHSLGGAISVTFTLVLLSHLQSLKSTIPGFTMRCYAYAPPPTSSENLAEMLKGYVFTFVNECDVFTRMCYGSMTDFREMMSNSVKIRTSKGSTKV
jgi:hypothetical protein